MKFQELIIDDYGSVKNFDEHYDGKVIASFPIDRNSNLTLYEGGEWNGETVIIEEDGRTGIVNVTTASIETIKEAWGIDEEE